MRGSVKKIWLCMVLVCTMALTACGGARSVAGTSAANCVGALQRAITTVPHQDEFRGLAQVNAEGLAHLGFGQVAAGQYCVVMFLNRNLSNSHRFVLDLYGYTEHPVAFVGHVRHDRKHPKLLDLA